MTVEQVAAICHAANAEYCYGIGDLSQLVWEDAPEWQRTSALNGVLFHLDNPDAGPSGSHESWLKEKLEAGWVYGEVKDPKKKEHPCIKPYNELPVAQQIKDYIFSGIVHSLASFIVR